MQTSPTETKLINKVSKWKEPYKTLGLTLHNIIKETKPELMASFMYGMPAYRKADTKELVCLFRHDAQFTFALLDGAKVSFSDGGGRMQPTAWYITELNDEVRKNIIDVLNKIV